MDVELINTGSELLLGRILNTHQQWLGRRLADLGRPVARQVTVPDRSQDIENAVRDALGRADLVITTGGLGPTGDDLTRERIAALLGRRLIHSPEIEERIRGYFASRGRPVPARTHVETHVPEGARVLVNRHGTASGLAFHLSPNPYRAGGRPSWLMLLPGPPRELHPMFDQELVPLLDEVLPVADGFRSLTFKTTGIGESNMEERLLNPLTPLMAAGLEVGFCARIGEVDVRFVGRGPQSGAWIDAASIELQKAAGEFIFGQGDDTLELTVVRELTRRGMTLALAESCTGGHVANRMTNIPGASAILRAGYVTYSNDAKSSALGVPPELIARHGAVSEPVARSMAEGARRAGGADYGLSFTGIAGPGGGSDEKPVGTVFIGLAGPEGTTVTRQANRFDRETFKYASAQQGLDTLRRRILGLPPIQDRVHRS
ncbi:MAG: competence/damage-inducible protein A [Verrucomicrobiales bacterium]|nr:competence/damage-inducible protein A [Verrucomicrobiales bacterium]